MLNLRYPLYFLLLLRILGGFAFSSPEYGVDCSFPIHSTQLKCGSLLGDRQSVYDDFMKGCRDKYGNECDSNEEKRIRASLDQPLSVTVCTYWKLLLCPHVANSLIFSTFCCFTLLCKEPYKRGFLGHESIQNNAREAQPILATK